MPGKVLQKTHKCNVLEEKLSRCLGEIVYFKTTTAGTSTMGAELGYTCSCQRIVGLICIILFLFKFPVYSG